MKRSDVSKSDYDDDVVPIHMIGSINQLTQIDEDTPVPPANPIGFIWEELPKSVTKRRRVSNRMGVRFVPER